MKTVAIPKRLLKAGAVGYLSKRSAAEELIQAIHQVSNGKTFLDSKLAQAMAVQQLTGEQNPVEVLSDREFEVFMLLAKGQSVAHIAEKLFLSPRTVGTHLYNIKQKLNAGNSAEITLIACAMACWITSPHTCARLNGLENAWRGAWICLSRHSLSHWDYLHRSAERAAVDQ